jgi:hypothetical protein
MTQIVRHPLLTLVALSACADGPAGGSAPDSHVDALPVLALEETHRIGSVADPEVGFSNIGAVWVAPAGEIWVAEGGDREIRVYDDAGTLVRTYGREGDGPGEFTRIDDFGLVGDTLWVADGSARRLTLFDVHEGEVLGTVTARVEVPLGQVGPMTRNLTLFPRELRPGGQIVGSVGATIYPNLPDSVIDVPRLVFDMQGNVIDTLEMVRTRVSRPAIELRFGNATTYVYPDPPAYDSGTFVTGLDSGSASVHWSVTGAPAVGVLTITRTGSAGDTIARNVLAYDPRPVHAGHVDSVAASRAGGRPGASPSDSLERFRAYRSAMQMPPHHPPVRAAPQRSDEGGAVWILLSGEEPDASRWIVVGEEGEVRGLVDLPDGAYPRWTTQDQVWLVERDVFDVPWLVGYRIGG